MKSFLEETAETLVKKYGNDLSQISIIFNNRRSGIYFKRSLEAAVNGACFLPQIISMDDYIQKVSGMTIVPHEYLLFELYDIHTKIGVANNRYKTFESFISFAEMMLSDFSEIDLYKVNAKDLFSNLHRIKEIEEWEVDAPSEMSFQKQYLEFYKSIYNYYEELHHRLQDQKKAYSGMAYRIASEKVGSQTVDKDHLYFVGFNVLSTSEFEIINTLYRQGKATLLTDGDDYYFSDEKQEAGLFLRKHATTFKGIGPFENHFKANKTIKIISCPENLIQAKYAGALLSDIKQKQGEEKDKLEDTALILADEKMIVPVLNSIPYNKEGVNVTMGYPYTYTLTHSTVCKIIALYERSRGGAFHNKEVAAVLNDNLISKIINSEDKQNKIAEELQKKKTNYCNIDHLFELAKNISIDIEPIRYLFDNQEITTDKILADFGHIAKSLQENKKIQENKKEIVAIETLKETIAYFSELQQSHQFITDLPTFKKLYTSFTKRKNVSLIGEPLSGLQILGMLEARNLDFKRLIMLSVNEGILPSEKSTNTFITNDLRAYFGLPGHAEKDAVYANHFYRLLQRSEEIYLLYNTQTSGSSKGELSRYIQQIKCELAPKYHNINIEEQTIIAENNQEETAKPTSPDVTKTQAILNKIEYIASEKGFSPTALNNYRSCPKKFYYTNILGINEKEEYTDELDQSELGTFIHQVICEIFTQALDKKGYVVCDELKKQKENLEKTVEAAFSRITSDHPNGKNHLLLSIAKTQIDKLLEKEINRIKSGDTIHILILEQSLQATLSIQIGGKEKQVNISGTADRIDQVDGHPRIIDYKTGKTEAKDLIIDFDKPLSDKSFQVLTYAWLYQNYDTNTKPTATSSDTIESGIYPLRLTSSAYIPATYKNNPELNTEVIKQYQQQLKELITEICDPEATFRCEPRDAKSCEYCPMKSACTGSIKQ